MSNDQEGDRRREDEGTQKLLIENVEMRGVGKKENDKVREEEPVFCVLSPQRGQCQVARVGV